ncbi:hypothetical protein DXV75_03065 [Alteromonas aestuariivivens]|uniref:Uncharacterized protein n=1 Tax=Alteromonas aestuariivivens TaxID=1938339 RepID=A0A3D8MBS9_9ALTE|nr:hypothetical protein [Alteromonas aestuariivivens]RDV27964.1 hypothetical protein DXV75_03065 [Alteromonas aestuariivivens]
MRRIGGSIILLCAAFCAISQAEQLTFQTQTAQHGQQFAYHWLDASLHSHHLEFNLPHESIDATPLQLSHYQASLAQRHVTVEMLKVARQFDPRDARITIRQRGEAIEVNVEGRNQQQLNDIQQELLAVKEKAYQTYLQDRYYVPYTTPLNQQAVKPDHIRFISLSTPLLIPASQAFYEQLPPQSGARDYFNLVLSWAQSIPYDPLDDRNGSNGAGFLPPVALLLNNKGDCDSKSVLTASIGRAFLPSTPMVLVLLPSHALLGIALPPKAEDQTIEWNGTRYVLMEPTGPNLLPAGQVAQSSLPALTTGQYTVEKIP